jgi:urease accessory protein
MSAVSQSFPSSPSINDASENPTETTSGWLARLELGFEQRGPRSALTHRRHQGPLVVQKPFYPEGDLCHVYLIHPPAGVVGGDRLEITVHLAEQAKALITTPGSGKFYRSAGPTARLSQHLTVANNASLEWLPQDTILFAGCEVDMLTHVQLAPGASFVGWEILCLGRPSSGESFDHGRCRQRFELWREDEPLLIDRSLLSGGDDILHAQWGLQGQPVMATMLATPATEEMRNAARDAVDHPGFSATLLDDVLVCRFLGKQGAQARQVFTQAWTAIRPLMINRPACEPRVWAT